MARPLAITPAGGAPPPTFEQPFEMLDACHERMERMLALLGRLRRHVQQHGVDTQAREAASDVMRYFDQAAPQHHLDEELHVFPALQASGDAHLLALVHRLRQDHREMEARWAAARAVLAPLAAGHLAALDLAARQALDAFSALYAGHLRAEQEVAFPAAQARIDGDGTRRMGEEMMRRRGVR